MSKYKLIKQNCTANMYCKLVMLSICSNTLYHAIYMSVRSNSCMKECFDLTETSLPNVHW